MAKWPSLSSGVRPGLLRCIPKSTFTLGKIFPFISPLSSTLLICRMGVGVITVLISQGRSVDSKRSSTPTTSPSPDIFTIFSNSYDLFLIIISYVGLYIS